MKRFILFCGWVYLLMSLLVACETSSYENAPGESNSSTQSNQPIPAGTKAKVVNIIDGDTIDVRVGTEEQRVRYIGVDTPERDEPYYREATTFNRQLVANQTVILVKDVSGTDRYGRWLRYVYLEDGTFVNAELIAKGYGRMVTFPPDVAKSDQFSQLQKKARSAELGLWGLNELMGAPKGCNICDRNAYDCRDFSTQDEAQQCFDYCQAQTGDDPHRLDGGGDGFVCESLP